MVTATLRAVESARLVGVALAETVAVPEGAVTAMVADPVAAEKLESPP
jgi:hypothetical protein